MRRLASPVAVFIAFESLCITTLVITANYINAVAVFIGVLFIVCSWWKDRLRMRRKLDDLRQEFDTEMDRVRKELAAEMDALRTICERQW